MYEDKIEIPSVGLLDEKRPIVDEFRALARRLAHTSIGWSYYLEWAWIFGQIDRADLAGKTVLDAGAGLGLSQWYLAEHGARVYSVDRLSRACLPLYLRKRYDVRGLREEDLLPPSKFLNPFDHSAGWREKTRNFARSLRGALAHLPSGRAPGTVLIYNQDLAHLADIPDSSVDLVVSTSSLEHNTAAKLGTVADELMRVLRTGGALIATLAASRDEDWFHADSHSQCYTDITLRNLFKLPSEAPSNYSVYNELMQGVRDCSELRDGLSYHYYLSGKNGMPWGRWKPVYLPVGVVRVKT